MFITPNYGSVIAVEKRLSTNCGDMILFLVYIVRARVHRRVED